jgi:hypothetical protein
MIHADKRDLPTPLKKADFQPGYNSVLVRSELKKEIEGWRLARGLKDTHYERCLTSALIEIGLDPRNEAQLLDLLAEAIGKDFKLSSSVAVRQTPQSCIPARSPG